MDFRRIEIIFLVVFLSLDVFLLVSFHNSQQVISNSTTGVTSTLTDMRKRNISFGKLDKKPGQAYYLGASHSNDLANNSNKLRNQEFEFNQTQYKLISNLENPISVTSDNRKAKLDSFLKKDSNVLFGSEYVYAPQLSSGSQIIYAETSSLGTMYDKTGQIVFTVVNGKVTSYTQTYMKTLDILQEKQETKSERDVVTNLYSSSEIPNNSKITYANLAYTKLLEAKGSTIYIPVWFITIHNKDSKVDTVKKVNAFTGNILKTSANGEDYSE
jgi:regulatory protein YycI of two-component signal transduction system YycFG